MLHKKNLVNFKQRLEEEWVFYSYHCVWLDKYCPLFLPLLSFLSLTVVIL